MRRSLIIAILISALAAASPAFAGEAAPAPSDPTLLMSPSPLPITRNGRLVNYIFVTLRLVCRPGSDMVKIRAQEPFFRDALIRAAARESLAKEDNVHLDLAKVRALMLREALAIAGPGVVFDVRIIKEQPQKPFVAPAG